MSLVTQYAYSLLVLLPILIGKRYTDTDDENLRPWVRKLKGSFWKYPLVGLSVGFCGWYLDVVMVPLIQSYIQAGPLMTVAIIIQVIIGIGLGLSIAKWATERAYRFWSNPHKNQ